MMSMQQIDVAPMDLLCQRLKANFPEITACSATTGNEFFWVTIAEETKDAPFMKAFDQFVKSYIEAYGNRETGYGFRIGRSNQLVNIISYNQELGYRVDAKLGGRMQSLFVVDVQGATGNFTVFDDDFNTVGYMWMREDDAQGVEGDMEGEPPHPDFTDWSLWAASNDKLRAVLYQIVTQVAEQIKDSGGTWDE